MTEMTYTAVQTLKTLDGTVLYRSELPSLTAGNDDIIRQADRIFDETPYTALILEDSEVWPGFTRLGEVRLLLKDIRRA